MKTTRSNAYVGQGTRDNVHIIKIGKSNDVKRRQRELSITLDRIATCVSEAAAYQFEADLRQFVMQQGGIRYKQTLDWFEFDKRIYDMLVTFFEKQRVEKATELSEEEEISLYREKYAVLLQTALEAAEEQIEELHEEIMRLRNEADQREQIHQERVDSVRNEERSKASEREQQLLDEIIKLNRQMARLEVRMEMLQERNEDEE